MQVVFVSSDSDIDGFNEYYEEMPWCVHDHARVRVCASARVCAYVSPWCCVREWCRLSVPFEDEETREKLSAHFEVEGIPTLAVVDAATGATVTKDGRAVVTSKKKLDGVF
ncbi:hypothetical protein EON67_10595 [archaeon]|nr:MAG: hypothetical protein EON67_10595 [archaeon]